MKNITIITIHFLFASLSRTQVMALPTSDISSDHQSHDAASLPPWLASYLAGGLNAAYEEAEHHGSSGGTVTVTPPSGGVNTGGNGANPGSITVTGEDGTENFGNGNDGNGGSITVKALRHSSDVISKFD